MRPMQKTYIWSDMLNFMKTKYINNIIFSLSLDSDQCLFLCQVELHKNKYTTASLQMKYMASFLSILAALNLTCITAPVSLKLGPLLSVNSWPVSSKIGANPNSSTEKNVTTGYDVKDFTLFAADRLLLKYADWPQIPYSLIYRNHKTKA